MTSEEDPICNICRERKSAHVATDKGPFTHPREARGEGHYEEASPGHIQGGFWPGEEYEVGPTYKFVPIMSGTTACDADTTTCDANAGQTLCSTTISTRA